jgi:hypothetical protein
MNKATTYGQFWHNEYLKMKAERDSLRESRDELAVQADAMRSLLAQREGRLHGDAASPYPRATRMPDITTALREGRSL